MRLQPATSPSDGPIQQNRKTPNRRTADGRYSVLVVDDDEQVAAVTSKFLKSRYHVLPFLVSLEQVDVVLETQQPDVVIIDIRFPDGDTSFRRLPQWCLDYINTFFIVRTGYPESAPPATCLQLGVLGYLVKPEDEGLEEVATAVLTALNEGIYLSQAAQRHMRDFQRPFQPRSGSWDLQIACIIKHLGFTRLRAEVALMKYRRYTELQIAESLGISEGAVHSRLKQLYQHHDIPDQIHLTILIDRLLHRHGLID